MNESAVKTEDLVAVKYTTAGLTLVLCNDSSSILSLLLLLLLLLSLWPFDIVVRCCFDFVNVLGVAVNTG